MHGEPSWSFLYRKMVGPFVQAGYRVLAPDLPGFGKSDKPAKRTDHSYARHVAWMQDWLRALDLRDIILICQDWGGLIGMRLMTHRFRMNPTRKVRGGGHFIQEDCGEELSRVVLDWLQVN